MTAQALSGRAASDYWSQRFRRHGHTGDTNSVIYQYDQEHRIAAIDAALHRTGRSLGDFRHALDVGCGTGDFSQLLLDRGVAHVTALDCSADVVEFLRSRFEPLRTRFSAICGAVEDRSWPPGPFDLLVSVDALQHVIDEAAFEDAVANLCAAAAPGAIVIVCEHTTPKRADRTPNEYVIVRARRTYVEAFTRHGCELRGIYGIPRIGVRLCRTLTRALAGIVARRRSAVGGGSAAAAPARGTGLYHAALRTVLVCTRPFERRLIPFPSSLTDMAILVFEKPAPRSR